MKDAIENKLPLALDYLTGQLDGRDFLVGDRMTIADIAIVSPFVNLELSGEKVDADRWPVVAAYILCILSQPSVKPIYEAEIYG